MSERPVFPSVDAEICLLLRGHLDNDPAYDTASKRAHRLEALLASDAEGCRSRINGTRVEQLTPRIAQSDEQADLWLEQAIASVALEAVAVLLYHGANPFLFRRLKHQYIFDQVAALGCLPRLKEYLHAMLNVDPDRAPVYCPEGSNVNAWLDPRGQPMPALTFAVRARQPFAVRWLLRGRHAEVDAMDGQGQDAMFWTLLGFDAARQARDAPHPALWEILRLLTEAGASMSRWQGRFPATFQQLTRRDAG